MSKESNNNFFSYQGTINRKNYIIDTIIIIFLYGLLSLVKFENFKPFISFELIYSILLFVVGMFKFVLIFSFLSLVYRRIADFSAGKS